VNAYLPMHNECNNAGEDIDLMGNLPFPPQRSLTQAIQASKGEHSLQVNFLSRLGTIDVYIYDESGNAVYQQSVNTLVSQQVSIDITPLSSGEYTIRFVNAQNQYLQGDFEI
jgi:hypothetical protein